MNSDSDVLPNKSLIRILELTQKLSAPFSLSGMFDEVVAAGKEVMRADSGSLWLFDAQNDVLVMRFPESDPPITVAAGQGLVGECLKKNEIINVRDCYADSRFNPDVDQETGYRTRSILSIPLIGFESSMVGVLQLLNKETGPFTREDEALALALAAQSGVALQRTVMLESLVAQERLDEEIAIAREIQFSTLPDQLPEVDGYDFAGGFLPAAYTGGDLFDLVEIGDQIFVLLGDATGHGFGPALSATQMQAMLRVAFRTGATLDEAYLHVNNQLAEDLPENRFLTAFMAFLDPEKHRLRFHSAGQGPILHYKAGEKTIDWHAPTSFPMGIMDLDKVDQPVEIVLEPGDILAVISDGVYEYQNDKGEQFGEGGVAMVLRNFTGSSMETLKDELLKAVYAFGGAAEQLDDITIVLVCRTGMER